MLAGTGRPPSRNVRAVRPLSPVEEGWGEGGTRYDGLGGNAPSSTPIGATLPPCARLLAARTPADLADRLDAVAIGGFLVFH